MTNKIQTHIIGNTISTNSKQAYTLLSKNSYGEKIGEKITYSLLEAMYLFETKKIEIYQNNKPLTGEELIKKFTRIDKKFPAKYAVFKDLRKKGYILKNALKFGADLLAYEKGKKPGKDHSKWIIFIENSSKKITLHDFSAKNRVAHSTNKNLLLAIVDETESILYYEIKWTKP